MGLQLHRRSGESIVLGNQQTGDVWAVVRVYDKGNGVITVDVTASRSEVYVHRQEVYLAKLKEQETNNGEKRIND